jgi:hypothetical protein
MSRILSVAAAAFLFASGSAFAADGDNGNGAAGTDSGERNAREARESRQAMAAPDLRSVREYENGVERQNNPNACSCRNSGNFSH